MAAKQLRRVDRALLWALRHGGAMYALDLMEATAVRSWSIYPALARLEQAGLIGYEQQRGDWPRRTIYFAKEQG